MCNRKVVRRNNKYFVSLIELSSLDRNNLARLSVLSSTFGSGVLRGGKWRGTVVHLSSVSLGHLEIVGHKEGAQGAEQR